MAMYQRLSASLLAGAVAFYPRPALAEDRKPIYDDYPAESPITPVAATPEPIPASTPEPTTITTALSSTPTKAPSSPTPTDLLTTQVRQGRLFLYQQFRAAEVGFNDILSRALHIENAFTNTIASLAPSPESGEKILPGGIYVVVAAMAGSIVARNRGRFLRGTTPLAFGTIAAWSLLPVTMRNVSDLIWQYEKRVPVVADNHLYLRERAEYIWSTGVAHSAMARAQMEEKIGDARKKLEEVVSKGH
ncbi:MICOS complex subunit MIC26/MIC27 [Aspergillus mulundensis]|uniref:MICOS complex subunit n=1 Tax=Aspergillus mulundensis TaxID=1810919 RepID=A0A3D8T5D7_9EURO|nr:MICOS complex subunit [Aspergillus mulundensis]RDW93772.1 MICOS complex subunit [Aspergillus mulundensis]